MPRPDEPRSAGAGRLLPLARLLEVAIHHVDLDIGYEINDIDDETAEWLLEWCSFRLGIVKSPKVQVTSDSGFTMAIGSVGEPVAVSGSCWISLAG